MGKRQIYTEKPASGKKYRCTPLWQPPFLWKKPITFRGKLRYNMYRNKYNTQFAKTKRKSGWVS